MWIVLVFLRRNTRMGEIHELCVLALSLVWFAGATLNFAVVSWKSSETQSALNFLQSEPRKFTEFNFSALAPIWWALIWLHITYQVAVFSAFHFYTEQMDAEGLGRGLLLTRLGTPQKSLKSRLQVLWRHLTKWPCKHFRALSMSALQREAFWAKERLLGDLRQPVPPNGRVHLLGVDHCVRGDLMRGPQSWSMERNKMNSKMVVVVVQASLTFAWQK